MESKRSLNPIEMLAGVYFARNSMCSKTEREAIRALLKLKEELFEEIRKNPFREFEIRLLKSGLGGWEADIKSITPEGALHRPLFMLKFGMEDKNRAVVGW